MNNMSFHDKNGTPIKHNDLIEAIFKTKKGDVPITTLVRIRGEHTYHVATRRNGGEQEMSLTQEIASLVRVVGYYDMKSGEIVRY